MKNFLLILWSVLLLGIIAVAGIKKQSLEVPPTEATVAETEAVTVPVIDQKEAGRLAAESMQAALEAKKVTGGTIGILGVDPQDEDALRREAGFREAFQGSGYTLLETRYSTKNPAMARSIAWQVLSQDAVGLYCCGPEGTVGAGQAVKAADSGVVTAGFGSSAEILEMLKEGNLRVSVTEDSVSQPGEGITANPVVSETGGTLVILESQTPLLKPWDLTMTLITADQITAESKSMLEGARKAAAELGCSLENGSPLLADESQLLKNIQQAASAGTFAILAAAEESEAVAAALQEAAEAGVTVIRIAPAGQTVADVVLSVDHRAAGRQAAEAMKQELQARDILKGAIGIIQTQEEDLAAGRREAGFREAFEGTDYTVVDTQYSGGDAAQSHAIAETLFFQKKAVGIFCCSEGCTIGAGNAVKARKSKVVLVGSGASGAISKLMKEGYVLTSLAVDEETLGYEAVKIACDVLLGAELETVAPASGLIVTAGVDAQS